MSDEGNTEEEKTQVPELYTLIQLIVGIKYLKKKQFLRPIKHFFNNDR